MARAVLARLLVENIQPRPRRGGWHGGPTPIGAVRGVSARQAAWAPARGRKSIWQLTLHVAYWKYAVRRRLARAMDGRRHSSASRFPRTPANWPTVPARPSERAWHADIALLRLEHERLLATVARVPASRYPKKLPDGKMWTLGELILGIGVHDAYHAGQIQMLKRLWSARRSV